MCVGLTGPRGLQKWEGSRSCCFELYRLWLWQGANGCPLEASLARACLPPGFSLLPPCFGQRCPPPTRQPLPLRPTFSTGPCCLVFVEFPKAPAHLCPAAPSPSLGSTSLATPLTPGKLRGSVHSS